jgi:SPP1 gp7 family putative phage head morphogenesis protein
MWRAQEVDGRIAAKNAVKIRAALRQSIDAKRIYAQYQETQPAVTDNPTQDRTRARAWAIINVRFSNESLRTALLRLYAEAWVTGDLAARAALLDMRKKEKALTKANDLEADVSTIDWDTWQPGDTASAMLLDPPQAFQNLVQRSGNLISGLDKTGYDQIGTALADAIRSGMPPGKAAKLIEDAVGSPARALTIAVTENSRVMNAAAMQRYRDAGIQQVKWMAVTAVGGAPCEKCAQNIGQVVELGASFNSGQMQPPAHPHCRCNLLPEIPDYEGYLNSLGYQVSPTEGGLTAIPKPKPQVTSLWDETTSANRLRGKTLSERSIQRLYDDFEPPASEVAALQDYQESAFYRINADLRAGKAPTPIVQELDSLFAKAPQLDSSDIYEYYRVSDESIFAGIKKGDIFIDEGFTSVTISVNEAIRFAEESMYDAKIRIIDTANRRKVWVDGVSSRTGMSQKEVIFDRGTPFTYVGKDKDGYHVLVTGRRNQ